MQKQEPANEHDIGTNEIEISLLDLVVPVWRSRWTVVIVTMLVAALGLAGTLYTAKYRSEGFFQLSSVFPSTEVEEVPVPLGIALSDYKRFAAFYADGERFADYVQDQKLDSAPGIEELHRIFALRGSIENLIEPVYPFTKLDAKNLMGQPKDSSNNVIGLQIHAENTSPQTAQQMVGLLGRYTLDSIVYLVYLEKLRLKSSEISIKMTELDNKIIKSNEQLEEYGRKVAGLKQIVTRYPSAANQQSQQVISVTPESARYLSPVTQLVTTEVQSSEATEQIFKARREQQQMRLFQEYYTQAVALLDKTKSGETVLRGLESVKDLVFKDENMADEVVKEVYNKITIANQSAINTCLEKCRFISGPTLPSRSTVRPALVLAGGLILGLFLSLVLVFCRNWWRENRVKING